MTHVRDVREIYFFEKRWNAGLHPTQSTRVASDDLADNTVLFLFFSLLYHETLFAELRVSVSRRFCLVSVPETTVVILRLTTKLETVELICPGCFLFRTFSFQVNGHFE